MRAHQLLLTPHQRLKAKRTPTRSTPQPSQPNEWWDMDMTKVLVPRFGGIDIGVVLDWYTKASIGSSAGVRSQGRDWLTALDMAVNGQCPADVRGQGLSLMRDHGGQPISTALMRACGTLGIQQAFPSYHNLQGKAEPARTMKEACLWLTEWILSLGADHSSGSWIADDNEQDLHSVLSYKLPR